MSLVNLLQAGEWAGNDIRLRVDKSSAFIEFPCAEAEINENIIINDDGTFLVNGIFKQFKPGKLSESPQNQTAMFSGKLIGNQMNLKISLQADSTLIGEFQLEFNRKVKINKCK